MKALLILAVFVALSSAYIIPTWSVYATYNGWFKPTAVLAHNPAVVGNYNTINVCGTANQNIAVGNYTYQVGQSTTVWYSGTINIPPQNVFAGASYCFDYGFVVPAVARPSFDVYLTLTHGSTNHATVRVTFPVN